MSMKTKEQIAVKQFKKSEMGSMEREEFERKFEEISAGGKNNVFVNFESGCIYAYSYAIEGSRQRDDFVIFLFEAGNDVFIGSVYLSQIVGLS